MAEASFTESRELALLVVGVLEFNLGEENISFELFEVEECLSTM